MEKKLGDAKNPLLLSVRSGAAISMPGMMETVLNLGLNKETLKGLIEKSGNERFAYDSYRRFVNMFGTIVLDIDGRKFINIIDKKKKERGVKLDTEMDVTDLIDLAEKFKAVIKKELNMEFPEDVMV